MMRRQTHLEETCRDEQVALAEHLQIIFVYEDLADADSESSEVFDSDSAHPANNMIAEGVSRNSDSDSDRAQRSGLRPNQGSPKFLRSYVTSNNLRDRGN